MKDDAQILKFLYGFLLLIATNQIILTPCILLHTSFDVAFYLVSAINLILVLISFFIKRKKTQNKIKKEEILTILIMCIMVFIQMLLSTITYKSNADDSFYISLSTCSIDSEAIYMEEPSMGYNATKTLLSITEEIPSYELQVAIWSKIFNINPSIMCHSVLPAIVIFIAYLAFYFFATSFLNKKYSKIFLIILSIIFLFTGFSTRFRPGYLLLRSWQGKSIFLNIGVTMILGSLLRIDKQIRKSNIFLLFISNLFSIALSSTAIFIVSFTYLSFGILKLIKSKWKDILYLIISCIPVIIYVIIFIIYNRFSESGYSVPREEVSIIQSIEYYKNYTYLIYYIISTIFIMIFGTKEAKKYFGYIQIINLLTIWNPIFSNIIAKYLTSSATFWRVLWLAPIEFAIAYCITRLFEIVPKYKEIIIVVCVIILAVTGKFMYRFEISENLENMPQEILEHTNYILKKDMEDEEIIVLAPPEPNHNAMMRQISKKIKLIYSRGFYLGKIKDKEQIEERNNLNGLYYESYIYTIEEFNKILKKNNIDWVIVNNEQINLINYLEKSCFEKDCEIQGYTLYKGRE